MILNCGFLEVYIHLRIHLTRRSGLSLGRFYYLQMKLFTTFTVKNDYGLHPGSRRAYQIIKRRFGFTVDRRRFLDAEQVKTIVSTLWAVGYKVRLDWDCTNPVLRDFFLSNEKSNLPIILIDEIPKPPQRRVKNMKEEQFEKAQEIKEELTRLVNAKIEYELYVRFHTPPGFLAEFPFLADCIEQHETEMKTAFMEHIDERIENLRKQFEAL